MSIRKVAEQDINDIRALIRSLSHYYLSNKNDELPRWFLNTLTFEQLLDRINSDDFIHVLYILEGEIVGYIAIKTDGHVYHLFVSERAQGQGIAKALWTHVKLECKCESYTVRSSIYAVPVYKSFGFVESGSVGTKDGISFQPMECSP